MVRHSLKILQHLPPDFSRVPDYFMALRSKGLKKKLIQEMQLLVPFDERLFESACPIFTILRTSATTK